MKLTSDQLARLFDHARSLCVPHTTADIELAKLGLIDIGHSRFGPFSRITEAGQQYVTRNVTSSDTRAAATGGTADTVQQSSAGTGDSSGRAARPNRTNAAPTRKRKRSSSPDVVSEPADPAAEARRETAQAEHPLTAPGPIPNAIRVTTDVSVTYYPLRSYAQIKHGTKQFVQTTAKLFRPYRLAASTAFTDVLCDPPAGL
jgi:hypothetical protein